MGRRHAIHIIDFTIRGQATVKLSAIPGGDASLFVTIATRQHPIGFTKHLVGAFIAGIGNRF